MFDGFSQHRIAVGDVEINIKVAGAGPPILLLHGYPQTHSMWHRIAPGLARQFKVICGDLRGYGDSSKPPGTADHATYAKRTMANDMLGVMRQVVGEVPFGIAGHDRGGRVAHRLCLDHPDAVRALALLDIVPTRTVFERTDMAIAMGYYHWFFLAQQAPLPERLIGADPAFYLDTKLGHWSGEKSTSFAAPEALAEYRRCFADPATISASCEDYRAAATIDLEHDRADEQARLTCPLLILWGARGLIGREFNVLESWRARASGPVEGRSLPCGHFLAEEVPEATEAALAAHFDTHLGAG